MPETHVTQTPEPSPAYKLDVNLHDLLMKPATHPAVPTLPMGAPPLS